MESLVSVIVPVYKVEKYLDETVSCLLKQTYRNLEIILVDDGSPDRCGEMCDEYARRDSRVKVIHKENGGLSSARNAGTEICTGDYIAYIDSDDVVSSDYIEYLLKLCGKHHVNMAICLTRDFQESGKPKFDYGLTWPESVLPRDMALKKFFYMDQIRTGVIGKLFSSTLKDSLYFHPGIYYEDARPMFQVLWRCDTVALGDAHKFGYRHRVDGITGQPDLSKDMDCVSEWNKIYRVVQKQGDHLLVAAKGAVDCAERPPREEKSLVLCAPVSERYAHDTLDWKENIE